jgi:hypothetical protein
MKLSSSIQCQTIMYFIDYLLQFVAGYTQVGVCGLHLNESFTSSTQSEGATTHIHKHSSTCRAEKECLRSHGAQQVPACVKYVPNIRLK